MTAPGPLGIDPGLLARFLRAEGAIAWRSEPAAPSRPKRAKAAASPGPARIARLSEEEARVEVRPGPEGERWVVESGPVGALVLIAEISRRGSLPALGALAGGEDPRFPNGAIVARWGAPAASSTVRVADLVEVARYALP
jgi:hypothetical protein